MALYICSKLESLQSKDMVKLELPDPTSNATVEQLFHLVTSKLEIKGDTAFELICFGRSLNPQKTLADYGIKSGTIIYVFKQRPVYKPLSAQIQEGKPEDPKGKTPKEKDMHNMLVALRSALQQPAFKGLLEKLSGTEFRENVFACVPGLREDPTAIAVLQDADLLETFCKPENYKKVMEKHPACLKAAFYLASAFHEDSTSSPLASSSGHQGFGMEISDDEDEDAPEVDPALLARLRREQAQRNAARQLSASLANAVRAPGSSGSSTPVITSEMLTSALNTLSQTPSAAATPVTSRPPSLPATPTVEARPVPAARDWSREIEQIRNMGIADEALIRHTLEATDGNIQLALDLILGTSNN